MKLKPKQFLLNCLFIFFIQSSFAQPPQMQWGEVFSYGNGIVPHQILMATSQQIFVLKGPFEEGIISNFSIDLINRSNLKLEKSFVFDQNNLPKSLKHSYLKTLVKRQFLYLFSTETLANETDIFCSKLNIETGEVVFDGILVGKENYDGGLFSFKDTHTSIFFSLQEKFIVIYNNLPNKTHQNEKLQYTLLDTNLLEIKKTTITLPYRDRNYHDVKYWVRENGDLEIVGLKKISKYKEAIPVLFNYELATEKQSESIFPLPEWHILSFKFFVNDKTLNYDGLYFDTKKKHTGIYAYIFDSKSTSLLSKVYVDLNDKELKTRYKLVYRDIKNFYRYDLFEFFFTSPDTLCYFLENQVIDHSVGEEYIFSDIIIVKTTPKGKVLSMVKLPKKQMLLTENALSKSKSNRLSYMRNGLLSASAFILNNKTYLLYNDHRENIDKLQMKDVKATHFKKNTAIMVAEVDNKNKLTRNVVADINDPNLMISSLLNMKIGDNELLTMGVNLELNQYKFGILSSK